ncbi:MAG TPA: CBS domain-containing protein [Candidatus Methylomirabilis sp.]|nr:CBS domain-containing protein [Candidatus Methylomirabilis sp.]
MNVRDVMTCSPLTVDLETSLREAAGLMKQRGIRHLPVVDRAGRLMGILTDRDIRHAAFMPALSEQLSWDPRRLKAPLVRDVMTWSVVTTDPEATLVQAGLTMFQRRIGSLPVVENGRLVGILTERDMLTALQKEDGIESDPDASVGRGDRGARSTDRASAADLDV